jgi:hypothetical protein
MFVKQPKLKLNLSAPRRKKQAGIRQEERNTIYDLSLTKRGNLHDCRNSRGRIFIGDKEWFSIINPLMIAFSRRYGPSLRAHKKL